MILLAGGMLASCSTATEVSELSAIQGDWELVFISTTFFDAEQSKIVREWRQAMQSGLSTNICRAVAAETRIGEDTSGHRSRFATSWSICRSAALFS